MIPARILVIDDEPDMRETCRKILVRLGHSVSLAEDGRSGLRLLQAEDFEVALVDLRLPDMDGIAVLREAKATRPKTVTIMITAHGTVETAIEAVRQGAFDYLLKPFTMAQLELTVERGLSHARLLAQNRQPENPLPGPAQFQEIVASSPEMASVLEMVRRVAQSEAGVLLRGESGTGKEVVARAIHAASRRSGGPFVPIDCAAIPANLLESECFGYEKGAFTGAVGSKHGLLEEAEGGTLFMDEIAELALSLQSKLLRVLQERQFRRLGGREVIAADFRLIAATNRDLFGMVKQGAFREDLYYRLDVVTIELPPLRERPSDIAPLANHFLKESAEKNRRNVKGISNAAMLVLENYHWPGNVRELSNAIERAVSLAEYDQITPLDLPRDMLEQARGDVHAVRQPFRDAKRRVIQEFEPWYLSRLLGETDGNVSEAARRAGMKRSALQRLLAKYGMRGRLPASLAGQGVNAR